MGWDSKPSYSPDATRRVSVKATPGQKSAWEVAARRHGKASPGHSSRGLGTCTSPCIAPGRMPSRRMTTP